MDGFVAPTDQRWYQYFLARPGIGEVNFWRPGSATFAALREGEPFFFKLKAPHNAIGGFGLFARFARLPLWRVWEVFGEENGVADERELRDRLARLAHNPMLRTAEGGDRPIGCISISSPVFFAPDEWVPTPADWRANIVTGRRYDLTAGEGRRLWRSCLERAGSHRIDWVGEALERERHGAPQLVQPRLGQGSFRIAVIAAYGGACAVTNEHSLPVVEAAHIKPWSVGGEHAVPNGLPLRRDLHRLFDLGYMTIRPDHRLRVSPRLREEYANGRTYYELENREIYLPADPVARPDPALLEWHGDEVFKAS